MMRSDKRLHGLRTLVIGRDVGGKRCEAARRPLSVDERDVVATVDRKGASVVAGEPLSFGSGAIWKWEL